MARAQAPGKIKHSFQIDGEIFEEFKRRARGLGINPGELTRRLITALVEGQMKLPRPEAIEENYQ